MKPSPKTTNKTICIDYLKLSYLAELPSWSEMPKTYRFNPCCYIDFIEEQNEDFDIVANLFIEDHHIGRLYYAPSKPYIKQDTVQLILSNWLLYTNDYLTYLEYLQTELDFEYQHITRIDPCIDTLEDPLGFHNQWLRSPRIRKKGSAEPKTVRQGNKTIKYFSIGSTKSAKYLKCYNKSVELLTQDKPYIKHFWKQNGLPYEDGKVQRLEMVLRNPQTKTIDLKRLTDSNYLASLMRTHMKNFYEFESSYLKEGKTRKKDVTPICFTGFTTTLLEKYKYVPSYTTQPEKIALHRLHNDYLLEVELLGKTEPTGDYYRRLANISGHIIRLKELYDLSEYYDKRKAGWKAEWLKNKRKNMERISL